MMSRLGYFQLFRPSVAIGIFKMNTTSAATVIEERTSSKQSLSSEVLETPSSRQNSVTWSIKDRRIAVVKIDCKGKKVNSLNEDVSAGLQTAFDAIEQNESVQGVVIMSGKTNNFIAGADIGMLEGCKSVEEAARLSRDCKIQFEKLEKSKKPVVAAIMGACMGGGLELAMACHYRIAVNTPKTQLSLPEVMIGLLPGGGGTQRIFKLVDIGTALEMMLTGKMYRPDRAKKIGLIDHLIQPIGPGLTDPESGNLHYLEKVAVETCGKLADGKLKVESKKPFLNQLTNVLLTHRPLLDALVLRKAKESVMKMTKGNFPAPLKIIDVVRVGLVDGVHEGYESETQAFGELSQTKQCAALIGIFFGKTECEKDKYGEAQKCEKLGVIGAGLMGAGIANVSINKGIQTTLIDTRQEALDRGLKQITTQMEGQLKRHRFTSAEHAVYLSKLTPVLDDYQSLRDANVVIEAVFEDIALKHKIIQKLEQYVPEHCVIATNTSALPIKEIASTSKRPERIIGMHYFSPVDKMQLLEIITSDKTSKNTLAVAAKLGLAQKKIIVVVKDGPGFFVVRCLSPMLSEAIRLMQEGVSPNNLDRITNQLGFPVGMATLADEVGLDVGEHVANFLAKELGPRVQGGSAQLLQEMVQAGFKGKKSGAGIYKYNATVDKLGLDKFGKMVGLVKGGKQINEKAQEILQQYQLNPSVGASSEEDMQMRILSRYVNEALICLEEGIIASPSDGDVASVFGVGFPAHWGGPFRFVDLYGADKIVEKMERYGNIYSTVQFQPCQLLMEHAKTGKKFYQRK